MEEQVNEVEQKVIGPFIRGKIRRVLNKTQPTSYKRHIRTRLS